MSDMSYDAACPQSLTPEQCRSLLGSALVGRIVFTESALPAIQPVAYAVADGDVVIRTAPGSKLAAAVCGTIVAFEIDDFDGATGTGWSVVVTGRARLISDRRELARLGRLPPHGPGRTEHDHVIRIRPAVVSGRRTAG
ncbi:MAG: pyridoxamine 5-phosphate oxidase-related FMN-binding protein [Streptosporangiaceae bacterium]|jgi:nitroimidazol reductase NimA-like FMN-containing flavoprotein (pyridoxamine 5'-phosphate oxidase superfamily)|nr:pyridoxamine 5-phosphate oxidase-related FMN-binding protein [Streptosporangiaceae bacterium]